MRYTTTRKRTRLRLDRRSRRVSTWLAVLLLLLAWQGAAHAWVLGSTGGPEVGASAPDAPMQAGTQTRTLAQLHGHKVVLWLLSTWCHTCVAGVQALERHSELLKTQDVTVLVVRNFKNDGYPGMSIEQFGQKFAPKTLKKSNWIYAEASKELAQRYNPRHFPDLYYLIDAGGIVRVADTAPAATWATIARFAQGK